MPSVDYLENELIHLSKKFIQNDEEYSFEVEGENNFIMLNSKLKEYGLDFVVRDSYLNRRKHEKKICNNRLLWQKEDIPFVIDEVSKKTCKLGPKKTRKNRTHDCTENGHRRRKQSRKIDCPAKMKIIVKRCFPEYKIPENTTNVRKLKAEKLKQLTNALEKNEPVISEKKFQITISKPSIHNHSSCSSCPNQQLSDELKEKVNQYVNKGITQIQTIQKLLKSHIINNVSKNIPTSSKSFYPTRKIIHNYVMKSINQTNASKVDQVDAKNGIEDWRTYVPDSTNSTNNSDSRQRLSLLKKLKKQTKDLHDKAFLIPRSVSSSSSNNDLFILHKKISEIQQLMTNLIC